jgi:hypothetical protein
LVSAAVGCAQFLRIDFSIPTDIIGSARDPAPELDGNSKASSAQWLESVLCSSQFSHIEGDDLKLPQALIIALF